MRSAARCRLLAPALGLMLPLPAAAHGFGRLYNLPVPFWLYAWAAVAALLLSFLIIGHFSRAPPATTAATTRRHISTHWPSTLGPLLPLLKAASVLLLLLCIATGWWGNRDPYRNFSMTFFWVVFVLGVSYLTALFGNFYAVLNPWKVLSAALGRCWPGYGRGRIPYRAAWGDWPALVLYLAFLWFELFGRGRPAPLASMLMAYTVINLFGVWLVGRAAWFQRGEFFSVFLRLIGHLAPVEIRPAEAGLRQGVLTLRRPLDGLVQARPTQLSAVAFALAMLGSTAFDGLRATQFWVSLFWGDPTGIVTTLAGARPLEAVAALRPWYIAWETFCLLAAPFIYLAVYLLCLAAARGLTGTPRSLRALALDFGYTMVPIALAYHLSHYATLLLSQGLKIISLASDPFGWGWNLFGTAGWLRAPILPGMGLVWHAQVGLILLGHIASVLVAHRIAMQVLPTRQQALLSQLPLLLWMMVLTVSGLWILAQPLTVELMR